LAQIAERGLILDGLFYEVAAARILRGVYLKVAPGRVCGLFGRNGSGKTTLLKVAAGQLRPSSGLVVVDGERFYRKALRRRFARVAYLPQEGMLPRDLTVRQLLALFPGAPAALADDPVLAPLHGSRAGRLSTGERRYLEIRLLLGLERAYLLLDEPFTGVEPVLMERISEAVVEAARRGQGVLVTDHYYRSMLPIVDDAYLMAEGRCRPLGQGGDLRAQLQEEGYLGRQGDPAPGAPAG
jgi:lipopolysaccharide export system ATP-binding protein